ncbi:hypothetical protein PC116_g34535 [Phytophthora cactorum]|nr:hypothetical protein PC116_g34535 [Phytophthora cactorum]
MAMDPAIQKLGRKSTQSSLSFPSRSALRRTTARNEVEPRKPVEGGKDRTEG